MSPHTFQMWLVKSKKNLIGSMNETGTALLSKKVVTALHMMMDVISVLILEIQWLYCLNNDRKWNILSLKL